MELSPSGPAGHSCRQMAMGVTVCNGAHVVLEDVDVVGKHGAGGSLTAACTATTGARLELNRCAGTGGAHGVPRAVHRRRAEVEG